MVHGANPPRQADEARRDGVARPHAQPALPPRETAHDHGRADHPRVDVERVGDPEADKVPGAPLAARGIDGDEVGVDELRGEAGSQNPMTSLRGVETGERGGLRYHELGGGQAWFRVQDDLVF